MQSTNGEPHDLNRDEKIEFLKLLDTKAQQVADKTLENMTFSKIQEEALVAILNRKAKIFIVCGSNQSGKSTLGGVICDIYLSGVIPLSIKDRIDISIFKTGRQDFLSLALDFVSSHGISQDKVFSILPKKYFKGFSKEFRILQSKSDSTVMFKSVDSGWEKIQGFIFDGIWVDEEPKDKFVWDESYMRTVARRGWMLLTFSPLQGLSWAYQELYLPAFEYMFTKNIHNIPEDLGIVHTIEEINKLRERMLITQQNTSQDANDSIRFYTMTIYDNIHISAEEIRNAEIKYRHDPLQYQARILGRFTKLVGREVFNVQKLLRIQADIKEPGKRYELENGQLVINPKGRLTVFKQKTDVGIYVIGADSAEGIQGGDYSCAQILDRSNFEQVAVWHGHVSPDEWATILYELGRYYNYAKLAPERNFHGLGIISRLRETKYPNMYFESDPATETISKKVYPKKNFGWHTNFKTKPIMIQTLASYINDNKIKLNDRHTIDELTTFVYDEDGKTNALSGTHDDRVMSLAIALMAAKRTPILRSQSGGITKYENEISSTFGF